jgi:hypothetical protein
MKGFAVNISLVEGDRAPRYDESGMELACEGVIITEQGTVGNLPIVDFKMRGPDGKFYLLVLSGRIVNAISAAVRGVNMRNHGVEEP